MSTTERKSGACIFRDIGFNAATPVQEKVTVYHLSSVSILIWIYQAWLTDVQSENLFLSKYMRPTTNCSRIDCTGTVLEDSEQHVSTWIEQILRYVSLRTGNPPTLRFRADTIISIWHVPATWLEKCLAAGTLRRPRGWKERGRDLGPGNFHEKTWHCFRVSGRSDPRN